MLAVTSISGILAILAVSVTTTEASFRVIRQITVGSGSGSMHELNPLKSYNYLAVDPCSRAIAVAGFRSPPHVIVFTRGSGGADTIVTTIADPKDLNRTVCWSLEFLQPRVGHGEVIHMVALVSDAGKSEYRIALYRLSTNTTLGGTVNAECQYSLPTTPLPNIPPSVALVPLPHHPNHFLLLQEGAIALLSTESLKMRKELARTAVLTASAAMVVDRGANDDGRRGTLPTCWAIDDSTGAPPSVYVGDEFGALYRVLCSSKPSLRLQPLCGSLSDACSILVALPNSRLLAFHDAGDGEMLQVSDGNLIQHGTIPNWSPVLDVALGDLERDGYSQLYACCGTGRSSTLRQIRYGIECALVRSSPPDYGGCVARGVARTVPQVAAPHADVPSA